MLEYRCHQGSTNQPAAQYQSLGGVAGALASPRVIVVETCQSFPKVPGKRRKNPAQQNLSPSAGVF